MKTFTLFSPTGKPAGVRCVQLDDENRCRLFGRPERPDVCRRLAPALSMCGTDRDEAIAILGELELATQPPSCDIAQLQPR